ncbi:MAG: GtrA family protein [Prevotella sp.]|nr:GtrA family protein [Prevotella sp.]
MAIKYEKIGLLLHSAKFGQFVRFVLNGVLSSAIHYGIYYVLLFWTIANIAYITGYLVSFVSNFFLTSYFTFRTKPTLKRFIGFSGSHALNFGLHVVLFNIFLWLGVHKLIIPLLVIGIAMMVQFFILRLVFVKKAG